MKLRPVILNAVTHETERDAMWAAIRGRKIFTASDVAGDLPGGSRRRAYAYIRILERGGYVQRYGTRPGPLSQHNQVVYRLIRDVGVERPLLANDGGKGQAGLVNERLWRTMKILTEFSIDDLVAHASTSDRAVSRHSAQSFVSVLHRAGYLVRRPMPPVIRWRCVPSKVRGPKPPRCRKRKTEVFDPNTNETIHIGGGRG